ncbi:unnamed protein product [Candidula unifasciata]|uniref:G-protein coupled receptors family 1 profile domain-containing protein n=1 Tax=Candidula unifasciata TaxID=100452 RepID=A0A8S3ZM98_9EUPU|nr:unnamed protein product [Candidula unifasciata]
MLNCLNITTNVSETTAEDTLTLSAYVKYYIMDIAVPCVCALGLTCLKSYYEAGEAVLYFEYLANGLITLFIISSTWLIVVMAAERYIAVCHPLRARKLISLTRTRASIILVFVICALSTIPIFLEKKIVEILCDDGRKVYVLEERNQHSVKLRRVMWAVFFDFIPCVALVYFNLCLIVQIHKAKTLRDRMTPKHSIIRYTSSGIKTSAQRYSPTRTVVYNCKHLYSQRIDLKQGRTISECTELTGSKDRHSHDSGHINNGMKDYPRFTVVYNGRDQASRSSRGPSSHSADSDSKTLNDNRFGRRIDSSFSCSQKAMGSASRKRPSDSALNSVTATLIAVVLLFLILVSPSELMKFSVGYAPVDKENQLIVRYVTNFMQVLNFSLNFVLYCAVNKTFRHTLRGLICCCWLSLRG